MNRPSWDETFMSMAYTLSKRSHDKQTQHGAIIVSSSKRILGAGYNGFMHDIDDSILPNVRPDKYPWMIHAEVNAVLNCEHRPEGATIYITGHPCPNCYQYIYQAGIKTIVYDARPERLANLIDEDKKKQIELIDHLLKDKIEKFEMYYYD